MTGDEIFSDARDTLGMTDNPANNAKIAIWAEMTIRGELMKYDWPEYVNENDSFTTDGSKTYDLTSKIDTKFMRVVSDSVRTANQVLFDVSKKAVNLHDPAHTDTGALSHFIASGRQRFTLYPFGSSGETVYLDWIELPDVIDEDTSEADMPFDVDRHYLILEGILWRGMRKSAKPDWLNQTIQIYRKEVRDKFATSKPINRSHIDVTPSW